MDMSDDTARFLNPVCGRILLVDDDPEVSALLKARLAQEGFEVACADSAPAALEWLASAEADVVLTDVRMAGMNGLELCDRIVASRPDVPVVVITASSHLETAIAAIRAGAYDFITKPVELNALVVALKRAVQHRSLQAEVQLLRRVVDDATGFGELLGSSTAMKRVYDLLERVVTSDASVLITGESGTGKELVARALHRRGRRSGGPFVVVNCSAMPEALLESELFGHVRGAFTDARATHVGLFQQASSGTLFLDEIGDLPVSLQPKLLRALQERVIRPLGSDHEVPFDVRLVAATNRDLEEAVEVKRFREDLYFRINVIRVELPPLRSRASDILVLAQHFIRHHAAQSSKSVSGLSPAVAERLLGYTWPGNVRELQNCIERAVALCRTEQIGVDDLPEPIRTCRPHFVIPGEDPSHLVTLKELEHRHIERVMEAVQGNRTMAAQILGIDRKTLHRKLEGRTVARSRESG
jgi:two-component system response regulator HydG